MVTILITVLLTEILVETLHREKLKRALQWIRSRPLVFIWNCVIILCGIVLLNFFMNRMGRSLFIISLVSLIFGLINQYKIRFRGDPLFPWDLKIQREGSDMVMLFGDREALLKVLGIIVFSSINLFIPYSRITFEKRLVLFISGVLIFFGTLFVQKILIYGKRQDKLYYENGFILSFMINIHKMRKGKKRSIQNNKGFPSNFSKEKMKEEKNSPDIIMIMNESFWDPSVMTDVKFSKDPAPTIKALRKNFTYGNLVSPDFGGGTSNIEFEVMTGLSMNFLPTGSMAFRYISEPIFSLPSYFQDAGYKTIGVHSYKPWFWGRDKVYRLLGFQEFISEECFENPTQKGLFISDLEFSKKVIQVTEENQNKPLFIYGVTMQNHGPYSPERYKKLHIEVEHDRLTQEQKKQLEVYTQGVYDADQALQYLIDHFSKVKKPTIILFFGDHLPMLGKKFSTFEKAGFIHTTESVQWTEEELLKMYGVPFVSWSNFPRQKKDLGYISTSFLGIELFEAIGFGKPGFFQFLNEIYEQKKVITGRVDSALTQGDNDLRNKLEEYEGYQNRILYEKSI